MEITRHLSDDTLMDLTIESDRQALRSTLESLPDWARASTEHSEEFWQKQRQAAQLMLIGTYRTAELIVSGHPLKSVKQELLAKQQCEELPLEYLTANSVAHFLSAHQDFSGIVIPTLRRSRFVDRDGFISQEGIPFDIEIFDLIFSG